MWFFTRSQQQCDPSAAHVCTGFMHAERVSVHRCAGRAERRGAHARRRRGCTKCLDCARTAAPLPLPAHAPIPHAATARLHHPPCTSPRAPQQQDVYAADFALPLAARCTIMANGLQYCRPARACAPFRRRHGDTASPCRRPRGGDAAAVPVENKGAGAQEAPDAT